MRFENSHVISFEWKDFLPTIVIYEKGHLREIPLSYSGFIDISASKGRWCVGSYEEDRYIPCPNNSTTGDFRQCPECAKPIIPILGCIFEPQCDGSLCDVEFCSRKHAVYLAFFGNLVKVGMTSLSRARKRAIEQGADAYTIIKELQNRQSARNFENHVSNTYRIPQAQSSKQVLSQLARKIDMDGIKMAYTRKILEMKAEIDRIPELIFLDGYPIDLPLRRSPVLRPSATRHHGKVLGIKGKYLIYEHSGIYALDLSDIVGRKIQGLLL